jgi:hypothetical protein
MAGRSLLLYEEKKRVSVAIESALDESLAMPGRLSFSPERLPRARPVADLPSCKRLRERCCIHPRHHQDLTGVVLLGDHGHEALCIESHCVGRS